MPKPSHKRLNIYLNPADLAILDRARADLGVRADTEIVRMALRALARERGYAAPADEITSAQVRALSVKLAELQR